jgi:hypothetical protein
MFLLASCEFLTPSVHKNRFNFRKYGDLSLTLAGRKLIQMRVNRCMRDCAHSLNRACSQEGSIVSLSRARSCLSDKLPPTPAISLFDKLVTKARAVLFKVATSPASGDKARFLPLLSESEILR